MERFLQGLLMALGFVLGGCKEKPTNTIVWGVCADYAPFEYHANGELVGFDIDLARAISKELGKTATFKDMDFKSVLGGINTGEIDLGISSIAITGERKRAFAFSTPYYQEEVPTFAILFKKGKGGDILWENSDAPPCTWAFQLGSLMDQWAQSAVKPPHKRLAMNTVSQCLQAVISGQADYVVLDDIQSKAALKTYPILHCHMEKGVSQEGYGILMQKDSKWISQVNEALKTLKERGVLKALEEKWLRSSPATEPSMENTDTSEDESGDESSGDEA